MRKRSSGFTWIELVLVLAVIALLGAMAIPGMQDTALRKQVKEGLALADLAKSGVQLAWNTTGEMPADNAAAGLPPHDKIVGNVVKDVNVDAGAITLTYGNNASRALDGKRVTLRPAIVPGQPIVPIAWLCHEVPVPAGMELKGGNNLTDVASSHLPVECRGTAPKQ
ncbi:MAG TPA: pilin [Usitatibacter sp.]|nr:pilin [Usitatibacter sp.]